MKNYNNKTIKNLFLGTVLAASLASCQKDFHLDELNDVNAKIDQSYSFVNSTVLSIQSNIAALTVENNSLKADLSSEVAKAEDLKSQIAQLEFNADVDNATIVSLNADFNAAISSIMSIEVEKGLLDVEIAELVADIAALDSTSTDNEAELVSLNNALVAAMDIEALLRSELTVAQAQVRVVAQTVDVLVGPTQAEIDQAVLDAVSVSEWSNVFTSATATGTLTQTRNVTIGSEVTVETRTGEVVIAGGDLLSQVAGGEGSYGYRIGTADWDELGTYQIDSIEEVIALVDADDRLASGDDYLIFGFGASYTLDTHASSTKVFTVNGETTTVALRGSYTIQVGDGTSGTYNVIHTKN